MKFIAITLLSLFATAFAGKAFKVEKYDFGVAKAMKRICAENSSHLICSYDTDHFTTKKIPSIAHFWLKLRNGPVYLPLIESIANDMISLRRNSPGNFRELKLAMGKSEWSSLQTLAHNIIVSLVDAKSYKLAIDMFIELRSELKFSNLTMSNRSTPDDFFVFMAHYQPDLFEKINMLPGSYFSAIFNEPTLELLGNYLVKRSKDKHSSQLAIISEHMCQQITDANPSKIKKVHSLLKSFISSDRVKRHPHHRFLLALTDLCYGHDINSALLHLTLDNFENTQRQRLIKAGLKSNNLAISRAVFKHFANIKFGSFAEINNAIEQVQLISETYINEIWPLIVSSIESPFESEKFDQQKFFVSILNKLFDSAKVAQFNSIIYATISHLNRKPSSTKHDIVIKSAESVKFVLLDKQLHLLLGAESHISFKIISSFNVPEIFDHFDALKEAILSSTSSLRNRIQLLEPVNFFLVLTRSSDFEKLFELIRIQGGYDDDEAFVLQCIQRIFISIRFPNSVSNNDKVSLEAMIMNQRAFFKHIRGKWGYSFLAEFSKGLPELLHEIGI